MLSGTLAKRVRGARRGVLGARHRGRSRAVVAARSQAAAPNHGHPAPAGSRGAGGDPARSMGRSPHPRPIEARPVARTGPVPRPGPTLAARPLPADRVRASGRDRRLRRARDRSLHADPGSAPRGLDEAEALPPGLRSELEALCAGVNAAAADRSLPVEFQLLRLEFEPFTPADALTLTKLLSFGLSTNWERELLRAEMARELGPELAARLDPTYPRGNPVVLAPGIAWDGDGLDLVEQLARVRDSIGLTAEATGSNNWAVAASRSATGMPLLAGDPHLPPGMPGIVYQVGLYLGDRHCRGASLAGLPGVMMGQNNDVAWSFTNAMADVMDLFIERIDGDTYEFEGEQRGAGEDRGGDPRQGTHRARAAVRQPRPATGRSSTRLSGPTTPSRSRFGSRRSTSAGITEANLSALELRERPRPRRVARRARTSRSRTLSGRTATARSATRRWAGSRCAPAAARTSPSPAGPPSTSGMAGSRTTSCPRRAIPSAASWSRPTTGLRRRTIPHHITSDYLDGYRARRIEQLIEASARARPGRASRRCRPTCCRCPGSRRRTASPGCARATSASARRSSGCAPGTGGCAPDSIAATIYQAFTLRLGREVTRAAIGDRDLSERWLDRADNGFIAHVTSPWRWQSHLLTLWDEGDEELIGRPWDELALDALRGALDDLEGAVRSRPRRMAMGQASTRSSSRTRSAQLHPLLARIFNRTRSRWGAARRRSPRSAGTPTTPSPRSGRPAGGWSPTRCARSARAGRRSPASPARWGARTTTTCRRDWVGGPDPADGGRGPMAGARAAARWRRLERAA